MTWPPADKVFPWATRGFGVVNLSIGISILGSNLARFSSPSFRPLLDLTGGQMWPYGLTYVIAGMLMAVGNRYSMYLGLGVGIVINHIFSGLFAVAMILYHDSAPTGWAAYGGYGGVHFMLLVLMVNQRRNDKRRL